MENGSRRLSETERLAMETGRPVLSATRVLVGDVQPDESAEEAAVRTGQAVVTETIVVSELIDDTTEEGRRRIVDLFGPR